MPTTINICNSQIDSTGHYIGPPPLPFPSNADVVICPGVTLIIFNPSLILGTGRTLTITQPITIKSEGEIKIPGGVIVKRPGLSDLYSEPLDVFGTEDLMFEVPLQEGS